MNIETVASCNKRINTSVRRCLLLLCIATMSLPMTGCFNRTNLGLFDGAIVDQVFSGYRDQVWARRAHNLRFSNCNRPYSSHFETGFEAGYVNICQGGDGYVPATPPASYWGFDYQTPDGAQCVNAWFEGYPAGVAAAKRDRAGTYRDIYVSQMIQSAIAQQNAPKTTPRDVPIVKPDVEKAVAPVRQASAISPLPVANRIVVDPVVDGGQSLPQIIQASDYDYQRGN